MLLLGADRPTWCSARAIGAVLARASAEAIAHVGRAGRLRVLRSPASSSTSRRSASSLTPEARQARLQEAQPDHRRQADLRPARARSRARKSVDEGRSSSASIAGLAALIPQLPEMAALVGMPPAELVAAARRDGARHRPARRRRLPPDRASPTTSTSAAATRRRCRWTSRRSSEEHKGQELPAEVRGARSAAARCRCRRRAHDGRRPDGRRRRHQPDPLLRRAAVRADGSSRPMVVAKGQDHVALQDPGDRRASTASPIVPNPPLARAPARLRRGRPA